MDEDIFKRLARYNMRGMTFLDLVSRAQELFYQLDKLELEETDKEVIPILRLSIKVEYEHIMNELLRRQTVPHSAIIHTNENAISEIKQRVNIDDVISWYCQLSTFKKAWRFKCTKHGKDEDPSGKLYLDQQSWWCFGCNHGGDIYEAVMWYENQDFLYALRKLSNYIGIDLSDVSVKAHAHPKPTEDRLKGIEKAIGNLISDRQRQVKSGRKSYKY